jgi:hypothetical protein
VRGVGGELFVVALDILVRGFELVGEGHDQVPSALAIRADAGMITDGARAAKCLRN